MGVWYLLSVWALFPGCHLVSSCYVNSPSMLVLGRLVLGSEWLGFPAVSDTPLGEPTAAWELRHNYSIPLLKLCDSLLCGFPPF